MVEAEYGWRDNARPGRLDFRLRPDAAVARAVLAVAGSRVDMPHGATLGALESTGPTPVGRYALVAGDRSWFVRVSRRRGAPPLEQEITAHLTWHGVPVHHPVGAGLVLPWQGETFRVDIGPLIDGRHFDGAVADLRALGRTLAACHDALRVFPRSRQIRDRAARRHTRLSEVRARLGRAVAIGDLHLFAERRSWAEANRGWLRDMVREQTPEFHRMTGAQCLHGEVHVGNVIFTDRAHLVDFEESVHTYAPPAWDLAVAVQRFCLPAADATARIAALEAGYGSPLPALWDMMRQIAWCSIATLVHRRGALDEVAPESEYQKFVDLERQARRHG